jgi:hypothetical protein
MILKSLYKNGDLAWDIRNFRLVKDKTGELGVAEIQKEFDFDIKRIFFLRRVGQGDKRGFHCHGDLKQLIICLSGSFIIKLDQGVEKTEIKMNANDNCLYLDGKVWREMHTFSNDSLILVLCDREYEKDYVIRDYNEFLENLIGVNNA